MTLDAKKMKVRRSRQIAKWRKCAKVQSISMRDFIDEVRRIHPENATPANMERLKRHALQIAKAMRKSARVQIMLANVFEEVNEES